MMDAAILRDSLCKTFCTSISVNPVPAGLAVSTMFARRDGDRLGFYVIEEPDGYRVEDDGDYLATLVASGVPVDQGTRGNLLDAILAESGAMWDRDTYEIRTEAFAKDELGKRLTAFLSALIRVRDLEYLTRETVRSTFREDATAALRERFDTLATFQENEPVNERLSEYPADLIVRPHMTGNTGALFFATTNEKLLEAELLHMQLEQQGFEGVRTIALIEDMEYRGLSKRKVQRTQNRIDLATTFRGDEGGAVNRIGRELDLRAVA